MLRVAWRVDRKKMQAADDDLLRIVRDRELILVNGQELTPKSTHPIPVNARGARDQFFGIQHVRRANRVDVYLCALLRKPARRACMVEVDMCQQDVGKVAGR